MRPGAPRPGGAPRGSAQPSPAAVAAMSGAVDLAAVKARNEAAARAAQAPAPAAGQYVTTASEQTFQADVLDRSFQVPVLIVVTSSRAPSSDQLAATLETIVTGKQGALVLVRVDADASPRLVQALQVQGVPAVYAVISGQLIPGFEGNLPEAQARQFVDAVLQAGSEAGLSAAPAADGEPGAEQADEPPADPRFTAAEDALEAGDYALATSRYQAILDQEPANEQAALALNQVRLLARLDTIDEAAAARADTAPEDVDAQLAAADLAVAGNAVEAAFRRLLDTVAAVRGDDRDRVRQRLLEYFDLLGPDDPRVPAARRELTRALF